MITKYDFQYSKSAIQKEKMRLTNQLWKLIPMRENDEDWKKQLNSVIIEVAGLGQIFCDSPQFLQVQANLEGLLVVESIFEDYRKIVFGAINDIQRIFSQEESENDSRIKK